jgi:hypothetical protein
MHECGKHVAEICTRYLDTTCTFFSLFYKHLYDIWNKLYEN